MDRLDFTEKKQRHDKFIFIQTNKKKLSTFSESKNAQFNLK